MNLWNSWVTSWTSSDSMRSSLEYLNEKALIYWSYGHLFNGDYQEGYKDLIEA